MFARRNRRDGEPGVRRSARACEERRSAGFTVIEILVVVLIVTLLAAIAVPGISKRARGNRARALAEQVATAYRGGRLNALGRGAATVVRYDQTAGTVTVLEAIQGTVVATAGLGAACATMPVNSCTASLTQWDPGATTNQVLSTANITGEGDFTTSMQARAADGTASSNPVIDICFTPAGRTFVRGGATAAALPAFVPMAGSARVAITDPEGVVRVAAIPPNGAARTVREP